MDNLSAREAGNIAPSFNNFITLEEEKNGFFDSSCLHHTWLKRNASKINKGNKGLKVWNYKQETYSAVIGNRGGPSKFLLREVPVENC